MYNKVIRVLLVEDDEDDYILTRRLLGHAEGVEFILDWAGSYAAGLETLAQHQHDIYLVDYQLGEENGVQFVRDASARGNTAPIILLTGQSDKRIDIAAMEAGATDYLVKEQITTALLERSIRYAIQRKQTEYNLRLAEEKYRSTFENAIYGILRITPDAAVIDANLAAARILGYASPIEACSVLTDVDAQLFADALLWQRMLSVLQGADHIENQEACFYRKDGSAIWIEMNLWVMRDETGKALFYEGSFQDISERKQAIEWMQRSKDDLEARVVQRTLDLREANDQLQRELFERKRIEVELHAAKEDAERANSAKTEFLSRISHELRTPLNSILGFAQLFEVENLHADDQDNVEQILRAGHHLLQLIDEVLDISVIEARNMETPIRPLVIDRCIVETLSMIRPLADLRHIEIHYNAGSWRQQEVLANDRRLKQVLINLLSNAVKYNKEAGSITVSCEEVPGNRLRVSIADTGEGISDNDLMKLFSPFERLGAERQNIEGNGLGLALSKRLIEALNGDIGVNSMAGVGSNFWIELPLVRNADSQPCQDATQEAAEALTPLTANNTTVRARNSERTVLYIEDDIANLALAERILDTRPNIHLLTSKEGIAGVEMAYEYCPDLIFLDTHLPDITGDEVTRRLQQNAATRSIPICMLSSDLMQDKIKHMLSQGATAYLPKPIDAQRFLELVDETFID